MPSSPSNVATTQPATSREVAEGATRDRRLANNLLTSVVAKVAYLVTRFFLPPLILAHVTLAEYGIWSLTFIIVGYLGMGAFGVSNVYVRYVARYEAEGDVDRIGRLLSTGLLLVCSLCAVALSILWWALPSMLPWLGVPDELLGTGHQLIFWTAAIFCLDLSLGAYSYVLHGLQRLVDQNVIWVSSFVLEAILIVVLLLSGFGITSLVIAFGVRYAYSTAAAIVRVHQLLPGLRVSPRRFDRAELPLFYGYGAIVQLSGFLGMFLRSIEKVLAGIFLGVQSTGLLDVAQKFPVMATSIPSSMNASYLPALSARHHAGDWPGMRRLYLDAVRHTSLVTSVLMGFLAGFPSLLLLAWLGADQRFTQAPLVLALFTLPFHANVVTGPASAWFRAEGTPRSELFYPLSQLLLVAICVLGGFALWGRSIETIAIAVACAMTCSAALYLFWAHRPGRIAISLRNALLRVVLPSALPYVVGISLGAPMLAQGLPESRLTAAIWSVIAGAVYLAACLSLLWIVVLDRDEQRSIRSRLTSLRKRLPRWPSR